MALPFRHLTSASQLTPEVVRMVFQIADEMAGIQKTQGRCKILADRVIALLFYEPSSRTVLSFQAAASRLGSGIISARGRDSSSLAKGESIEDTIRMVMGYADLIVMRHPESGAAEKAAKVSAIPFINAGDGGNEHPTQALLDLYTIQKELGRLENLHIAFACDPHHSRTIRSLARSLSHYTGNRFTFISPPALRLAPELLAEFRGRGVICTESESLADGVEAHILYMNRLQEERFADRSAFEKLRKEYILTADLLRGKGTLVMDPLPRIDEIDHSVDLLPNALYFRQAHYGIPVRMALLAMMLEKA